MVTQPDILDPKQRWGGPVTVSLAVHGSVVASIAIFALWNGGPRDKWGDPNSQGGGSVAITAVNKIPLPSQSGRVNPVANDTESQTPAPPKKEARVREKAPDPEAISLKGRERERKPVERAATPQFRPDPEERLNQVYTSSGQRAVSPMIGITGSGGVGTSTNSPFGTRFGYYEQLLRQKVAEKWRTQDIDGRIRTLPVAIVTFTILRDGGIQNVKILQTSGNYVLDQSAQRAIYDAAPLPPLPTGFERDSANIEFWFELKR